MQTTLRSLTKTAILFLIAGITIFTISRLVLVLTNADRFNDSEYGLSLFLMGLRFDMVLMAYMLLPVMLFIPLVSLSKHLRYPARIITIVWLTLWFSIVVLLEVMTPAFSAEYDARPNYLVVEYLVHPKELTSMLWEGYRATVLIGTAILVGLTIAFYFFLAKKTPGFSRSRVFTSVVYCCVGVFVCAQFARSSFDHRPINPSVGALSGDSLVNDLSLNSTYSLAYALYENSRDGDGMYSYGEGDSGLVLKEARISRTVGDISRPSLHQQIATHRLDTPKNLVILIEESLGAEFVGSLGGLPLTPNIDRYKDEGIWFNNLYATGTRSARGLEAIVSGFPPTAARSTVKLGKTQRDFFTLASLLSKHDYSTSFLYGGEAHFDNMRRFFSNNGFQTILDKHQMPEAKFVGSWGVSDEDLFELAHAEYSKPRSEPFFSLLFTTTNHTPFEFPDDRIELYDAEKQTVNNAVKYADFALGQFIEKAKTSNYWNDTVILVVSDHNSRVYGNSLLPVKRFHIPGFIVGGGITPEKIDSISSQIDLIPTLLSLIGLDTIHPVVGRDMTKSAFKEEPGRAIMQFYGTFGYLEDENLIVLRRDMPAAQFTYRDGEQIEQSSVDQPLLEKALAYTAFPIEMVRNQSYNLP